MVEVVDRPVLVLNRHWLAVHVCTVRRAIALLYQRLAHVVTEDWRTYDFDTWRELSSCVDDEARERLVRTPQFQMMAPKVIVLGAYQKTPPRAVRFNRRNIFLRDGHSCQYCGKRPPRDELTIDHVVPRSRGGRSTWENVVVACVSCNSRKGSRLSSECGMHPRVRPRRPSWTLALRVAPDPIDRGVWERFIDKAYWEVDLVE